MWRYLIIETWVSGGVVASHGEDPRRPFRAQPKRAQGAHKGLAHRGQGGPQGPRGARKSPAHKRPVRPAKVWPTRANRAHKGPARMSLGRPTRVKGQGGPQGPGPQGSRAAHKGPAHKSHTCVYTHIYIHTCVPMKGFVLYTKQYMLMYVLLWAYLAIPSPVDTVSNLIDNLKWHMAMYIYIYIYMHEHAYV